METKAITENVFSASASEIVKIRSSKSVVIGTGAILVGIVLAFLPGLVSLDTASAFYTVLVILSIALIVFGLYKLMFGGKTYVYEPTRSKVRQYSLYFKQEASDALFPALEGCDPAVLAKMQGGDSAPIRLDVLISEDKKFASCQIFQWIPYNYEPLTGVKRLSLKETGCVVRYIDEYNTATK